MVSDTLLIRHFPASLTAEEIDDFLKHIGAVQVLIHESKIKKYSYAFAKFENEQVAAEVVTRVHQKELLGSRLIVEFANDKHLTAKSNADKREKKVNDESKKSKMREAFLRNLNNWTAGLNFALPPPYHLKYRYDVATPSTLFNIANMLSFNVKFYTQVLHLMNKMNLPSPFESTFPLNENGIFSAFIEYVVENCKPGNSLRTIDDHSKGEEEVKENDDEEEDDENEDEDEEESELESDDQENTAAYSSCVVSFKRKCLSVAEKSTKKRRRLLLKSTVAVASSKSDKTCIEDVFERVERDNYAKKIEVKINTANAAISRHSEANPSDEKNQQTNIENERERKSCSQMKNAVAPDGCVTAEQLASNKIPERDWQMLPFFKNYRPGAPSSRLYIKNLSKHVTVSDLNYIFTRYSLQSANKLQTKFDIRLMQEGRMKGQAFVTLENVELAELALKETNGYILKGKPMVVQFAKAPITEDKRCD